MKVMKGKMRQVLALLLIVAMVVTTMQISPVQAQAATQENLVTTYDGEGYTVTFKVTSQWTGAFNADVTIKNTSDKVIDNWALGFAMPYEITKIWDGVVKSNENGMYEIKNAGSNQDIAVGNSVNFGFSAKADGVLVLPNAYDLLCFEEVVAEGTYEISFKVTSDWKSAFNGEIQIKNISEVTIEDWKLEFDFDHKIDRFWTAEILKQEGNHYYIKNAGYNANIKPGETVVLGFDGNPGDVKTTPLNFGLSQMVSKIDETKDSDGDKLSDYYELIIGTNPRLKDTDQDGLEDGFEVAYGLNPLKPDSNDNGISDGLEDFDKDGLTCIEEVQIGTLIYEADTDYDHLNDGDEVKKYFTNPLIPDTDADGLADGAEIKFGMDPCNKDSNGDGILDGDEKIDQILVQSITSEERKQVTQVSVSMKATGDIQDSTKIENTYGKDVLSSGVVGLIGVPVNIESTSVFDEATITFTYDDTLLGETKEEDLRVMWYDEENNQYVIMDEETVLNTEQNTVSYKTTHFSTYLVVDRKAWYHVWSEALSYRRKPSNPSIPTEYFDICYVIDRSGSMSGTRIANAKMAIEGFVDAMYSNDRGAIVGFESYASAYSQFTSDKMILKNSLSSVYASGGTSVEAGLKAALDLFDVTPDKVVNSCVNSKMILLLCDGDVYYTEATLQRAVAKGIKIYPVLIGSTGGQPSLQRFADVTGGKFYYAATAEEIRKSIFGVKEETIGDIDTTDTDGDGLYDIYETAGMILPNGQYIYSDPLKRDTDDDGLTDAKEMGVLENYDDQHIFKKMAFKLLGYDNEVYAEYFDYTSNPNEKDSDNDTYNDNNDNDRLNKNLIEFKLKTNYFKSTALEEDYVPINREGNKTYGGDQGWFIKDFEGLHAKNLKAGGCGVIAGTDLLIYLLMNNEEKIYNDELYNGNTTIESDRYMALSYMIEYEYLNVVEIYSNSFGVICYSLSNGMNRLFSAFELPYKAKWLIYGSNGDQLCAICIMLENNIPTTLLIGDSGDTNGVNFYTRKSKASGGYEYSLSDDIVTGHYVNVTGVTIDSIDNSIYLQISSWGEKLYINFEEYIAYRGVNTVKSLTSGILFVEGKN